jgi:hypothetical protein
MLQCAAVTMQVYLAENAILVPAAQSKALTALLPTWQKLLNKAAGASQISGVSLGACTLRYLPT